MNRKGKNTFKTYRSWCNPRSRYDHSWIRRTWARSAWNIGYSGTSPSSSAFHLESDRPTTRSHTCEPWVGKKTTHCWHNIRTACEVLVCLLPTSVKVESNCIVHWGETNVTVCFVTLARPDAYHQNQFFSLIQGHSRTGHLMADENYIHSNDREWPSKK